MYFDIKDLKLFFVISEEGSIICGVEKIYMFVVFGSVCICNFEQSINLRLLYCSSKGIMLFFVGEIFKYYVSFIVNQMEMLCSDMQEYVKGIKGYVRIFFSIIVIVEYFFLLLSYFFILYNDVNIDFREYLSLEIVCFVIEGKIDFGIVVGNIIIDNFEILLFCIDRLVFIIVIDYFFVDRKSVIFYELI